MKKEVLSYSPREVSIMLNNAAAVSLHPTGHDITDARLRRLRNYAQALIEPLMDHVNGGVDETGEEYGPCLRSEELVAILACAALFTQATYVTDPGHLPQARITNLLFKKLL